MEQYTYYKNKVNEDVKIKLSSVGYLCRCDYGIYNAISTQFIVDENIVEAIQDGGSIYVHANIDNLMGCLDQCCRIFEKKNIKINWYFIWEPVMPTEYIQKIKPYAHYIFLTNNVIDDPQLHCHPIGFRDGRETNPYNKVFTQQYLVDEKQKIREKKYLCLLCYSNTHFERIACESMLSDKEFVYNLNNESFPTPESLMCGKIPLQVNYGATHESKYVLAPRGCGEATHRFWEALYFRAIPIVKRTYTAFDKLYTVFPCLVVNDWNEVSRELLESKYEELKSRLDTFWETYPNWYNDLDSIQDLLLKS